MAITHTFVSPIADAGDTTLVQPSNWNADHTIADASISIAKLDFTPAVAADITSAIATHAGLADPHTGYRLESADHTHQTTGAQAGQLDHGLALTGLSDNDHPQYLLVADIDDTPVNGEVAQPISSNWAFDHEAAADPHTGYRLESADHTHQSTGAQAGQLDHGLALTGLTDDDHTQYLKERASGGVEAEVPEHEHGSTTKGGVLSTPQRTRSITFVIDGGGSTITTGIKGDLEVPFACTITAATLLADQSGAIVIDIWKDTYANYPPIDGDSITSATPPTITASGVKSQDTTLSSWITSVAAGDTLRFNVDSVTSIQRVTLSLKVTVA